MHHEGTCLREVLSDYLRSDDELLTNVGNEIAAGRAVVLPNALEPTLAERVHASLLATTKWQAFEIVGPYFSYRHHNLYYEHDFTPELQECNRIFSSQSTRRFMTELTRLDCGGRMEMAASMYLPGDYQLPHSDAAHGRSIAYIWYLSKNWKPEWGGHLVWCPTGAMLNPSFNSLLLFQVTLTSLHFVSQVSPHAQGRRLSVNGWWRSTQGTDAGENRLITWPLEMVTGNYGGGTRMIECPDQKSAIAVL